MRGIPTRSPGIGASLGVALLLLLVLGGCRDKRQESPPPPPPDADAAPPSQPVEPVEAPAAPDLSQTEIIDAHLHLTTGATADLLTALDRYHVDRAVILSTPHLDPEISTGSASLDGYRQANELVLAAAQSHPDRFIPFVTVDLGETEPAYLASVLDRGACGVKIYQGHRSLRRLPLDHASHRPLFSLMEKRGTPVLLHVNTVRYRDELARLLRAHPKLDVVCAHLCGSRTSLDRLAGLLREFPRLRVDTSHGAGMHGAAGFANLEQERERLRAMIEAEPERFLFGSDLVTSGAPEVRQGDWGLQLDANLGLLTRERFRFWRQQSIGTMLAIGEYAGTPLADPVRAAVLGGNARKWLARCLPENP